MSNNLEGIDERKSSAESTTPSTGSDPAWWIATKVALFVGIPGLLMYLANAFLH